MFWSKAIEVAVGLALVYLLFSLICTVFTEWVAALLALRASTLKQGIHNLLTGVPKAKGDVPSTQLKEITSKFLDHPLIKGLAKRSWLDRLLQREPGPSFVPPRTFTIALWDVLADTVSPDTPKTAAAIAKVANDPEAAKNAIEQQAAIVEKLEDSSLKTALLALLNDAASEAAGTSRRLIAARENTEAWFNSAMDRVSGWYKRRTQVITILLALVIVIALNIDSWRIGSTLWRDDVARAAIDEAATRIVVNNEAASNVCTSPTPTASATAAATPAPSATPAQGALPLVTQTPTMTPTVSLSSRLDCLHEQVDALPVPLGWGRVESDGVGEAVAMLGGWVATIVALSLGAPFWFDTLSRLVNLRLAGAKPEVPKEPEPKA